MEGELIFVAIIMQVGTLITILLWSNLSLSKYFKKENFKTALSNTRAVNKINLDKLRKEMGLQKSKTIQPVEQEQPSVLGTLGNLAPLLKHLDSDQIGSLIETFTGGGQPEPAAGGLNSILDNIPPELIESFLKGLSNKEAAPGAGSHVGQG